MNSRLTHKLKPPGGNRTEILEIFSSYMKKIALFVYFFHKIIDFFLLWAYYNNTSHFVMLLKNVSQSCVCVTINQNSVPLAVILPL